ncbi:MAG: polysaccharide deacetylase family protein [Planctomycetes bacterium]|nr:polysaccharide deacetylase family protein [Planctomycetota bacterium]
MARALSTISIDVDPIDIHLRGYGVRDAAPDALVYTQAIPRLIDALKKVGIRATFFFVARDAEAQAAAIQTVVAAGHEVASHSLTHPTPFRTLPAAELQKELVESKRLLEKVTGKPVIGFRAPNWDCDESTLRAIAAAGYLYDASSYPSPYLFGARLVAPGSGGLKRWPFSWVKPPHTTGGLWEFPVAVDGFLRKPVYHTLRYRMSEPKFIGILDRFDYDMRPFVYTLHAVDVLGLKEDNLDARFARHPGMDRTLEEKRSILRLALEMISSRFNVMPFGAHRARLAEPGAPDRLAPS